MFLFFFLNCKINRKQLLSRVCYIFVATEFLICEHGLLRIFMRKKPFIHVNVLREIWYLALIARDGLSPALRADPDSFRAQKEIKTM